MLKKLTKEQTISGHRKMWNWIADKIEESKIYRNRDKSKICKKYKRAIRSFVT